MRRREHPDGRGEGLSPLCPRHGTEGWRQGLCLQPRQGIDAGSYRQEKPGRRRSDRRRSYRCPASGSEAQSPLWILARCEGKVDAVETPIGYVPNVEDIDIEGLDVSDDTLKELLTIDKDVWNTEVENIDKFYEQFGDKLPAEIKDELSALKSRLN